MTVYLNWCGPNGRETVDQIDRGDGQTARDFRAEVRRLVAEYRLAGMAVYQSRRPCRAWVTA